MQVYLIGKTTARIQSVCRLLEQQSIAFQSISVANIDPSAQGIYVIFASLQGKLINTINQLIIRRNLVMTFQPPKSPSAALNILTLPDSIDNEILVSIIHWFAAWKEKEAHFNWITDELQKVNDALIEEKGRLEQAHNELDLKNKKITNELVLANIIQNSFLPKNFPKGVPFSFTHKYIPHEYIGGDFFEIIQINEQHVGIIIADVSGHGVSSALITAMLKSSFAHAAKNCCSPATVLSAINTEFTQALRTEYYITAFYTIINTETLVCRFANAGHPLQLIARQNGAIDVLGAKGFFLGMFEQTEYEEKTVGLQPGDRLVFFTDGIIECPDKEGKNFGRENLVRVLREHPDQDIESLSKSIITDLISHMAAPRFPDDITLLIAEVIPLL